eukprot:10992778-Ditylum_brightwellii.AAC.1
MGRMVDMLENALEAILGEGTLILDENFMMGIFKELQEELPPFAKYWSFIFEEEKMVLVAEPQTKQVPFYEL